MRMLDFTFRDFNYLMAHVARNAKLSRKTLERELLRLLGYGVVEADPPNKPQELFNSPARLVH